MGKGNKVFAVRTHDEYVLDLLEKLRNDEVENAIISTMNLRADQGSKEYSVLQELQRSKKCQVWADLRYTKRMSALPNGHFTFRINPFEPKSFRQIRASAKITDQNLQEFSDIIINVGTRSQKDGWKVGKVKNPFLYSRPLRFLGVQHAKIGLISTKVGAETTVSTGEFVSVGNGQNNIALTFYDNEKLSQFLISALDPKSKIDNDHVISDILPGVDAVVDYGCRGKYRRMPKIHERACKIIEEAKEVALISQYVPDGAILESLVVAAKNGAKVLLPLQPKNDYRRKGIGIGWLTQFFLSRIKRLRKKGVKISTPDRKVPSHTKCLIVKNFDGTSSMVFGSDNFDSAFHKMIPATEVAICIDRAEKGTVAHDIIEEMRKKLIAIGDIPGKR